LYDAGEGIMSGFDTSTSAVPVNPTNVDKIKPGPDRSTRYQRKGLTSANVRDACSVDAHGNLRYPHISHVHVLLIASTTYNRECNPNESTKTSDYWRPLCK
jgi:hypothetical protein